MSKIKKHFIYYRMCLLIYILSQLFYNLFGSVTYYHYCILIKNEYQLSDVISYKHDLYLCCFSNMNYLRYFVCVCYYVSYIYIGTLLHWYQQNVTTQSMLKFTSFHKAVVLITKRACRFHDFTYYMYFVCLMYHVFLQIFLHILKSFHEFCNTLYREQILHYFN